MRNAGTTTHRLKAMLNESAIRPTFTGVFVSWRAK